jgi:hypothetical protein
MAKVVHLKLQYFGHVMRSVGELALMVLVGKMEGIRLRGTPRKQWLDNIWEWLGQSGQTYHECKILAYDHSKWIMIS